MSGKEMMTMIEVRMKQLDNVLHPIGVEIVRSAQ